ncbi:MAG: hypothetical protein ACFFG0_11610 [Candidatus Thorarchaeota archaeon]
MKDKKPQEIINDSDPVIEKLLPSLSEIERKKKGDKSTKKRIVKVLPEYRIK